MMHIQCHRFTARGGEMLVSLAEDSMAEEGTGAASTAAAFMGASMPVDFMPADSMEGTGDDRRFARNMGVEIQKIRRIRTIGPDFACLLSESNQQERLMKYVIYFLTVI